MDALPTVHYIRRSEKTPRIAARRGVASGLPVFTASVHQRNGHYATVCGVGLWQVCDRPFRQHGLARFRPSLCENSALAYVQRSTETCDSVAYLRAPALRANCDPPACPDRNILKSRNDFRGPILSFHTGWAIRGTHLILQRLPC